MELTVRPGQELLGAPNWQAGQPLWQRVPKRDAEGHLLADFMMAAPSLKGWAPSALSPWLSQVEGVLKRFGPLVVFADFNLNTRLLWVSHQARHGLGMEIVTALRLTHPSCGWLPSRRIWLAESIRITRFNNN